MLYLYPPTRRPVLTPALFCLWLLAGTIATQAPAVADGIGTARISQSIAGIAADGASSKAEVSADGRYVVFASSATNLVADDTNAVSDIFLLDRSGGTLTRVSVSNSELQADGASSNPRVAGTRGRFIVFESEATNLVSGDSGGKRDCFLRDTEASTTERLNVDTAGGSANDHCSNPAISDDGTIAVFESAASDLVATDTGGFSDIFIRNRTTATTTRISNTPSGAEADGASYKPVISPDGRFIVFESEATDLTTYDSNDKRQIYLYDRSLATVVPISIKRLSSSILGNDSSSGAALSDDGQFVVYESAATDLISSDDNAVADCFLYNRTTSTTTRISISTASVAADASCTTAQISADGRYVAFASAATNLVSADTNGVADIFVRDTTRSTTTRLSTGPSAAQGNAASSAPSIADDGNLVTFTSAATNLIASDTNGLTDIFSTENDICLDDPLKSNPGTCGCGVADDDTDSDSVADCLDDCPSDTSKTSPGSCGCGVADTDANGNGAADCLDPTLLTVPGKPRFGRLKRRGSYSITMDYVSEATYQIRITSPGRSRQDLTSVGRNQRNVRLTPGTYKIRYQIELAGITTQLSPARQLVVR